MSDPVSSIRNIGPAFEHSCAQAGVQSADQLRALGADTAYEMLLRAGQRPHFIVYYVLLMALQDRPWNDCKGGEKKTLCVKLNTLKTRAHDPYLSKFERIMDLIGVRSSKI